MITFSGAWGLPLKLSLQKYTSQDTLFRTAAAASWPAILQVHIEHSLEDYYSESMTTDYISISKGFQRTKISGLINCLIHVYLPSELYIQFKRVSQHPNNLLPLICAEELFESYFLVFLKADQISKKKNLAITTFIFWHITFNYLLRMHIKILEKFLKNLSLQLKVWEQRCHRRVDLTKPMFSLLKYRVCQQSENRGRQISTRCRQPRLQN